MIHLIVNRYSSVFNGTTNLSPLEGCYRGIYSSYCVTHISSKDSDWFKSGVNHKENKEKDIKSKEMPATGWMIDVDNLSELLEKMDPREQFLIHRDPLNNLFLQIIDEHNYIRSPK